MNLNIEKAISFESNLKDKPEIIRVSISCITYNHENYIAKALDSFLMQDTNFKYEILVHDDASTDNTSNIIKEYQKRYPDIIRPILQKENQYSKGIKNGAVNSSRAKGKYVALCEGDDFWTSTNKLQAQYDILEKDDSLAACFHKVMEVDEKGKSLGTFVRPESKEKLKYDIRDIINFDGGTIHASSLFYKKSAFFGDSIPSYYHKCVVGDLPIMLTLAAQGDFYYIDSHMSSVRRGVKEGATSRLLTKRKDLINSHKNIIKTYKDFNKYNDFKYDFEVNKVVKNRRLLVLENELPLIKLVSTETFKKQNFSLKIKIIARNAFPQIYNKISKIKRR